MLFRSTQAQARISIRAPEGTDLNRLLDTLWLEILWVNYGPFGRLQRRDGVLIPLRRPAAAKPDTAQWRQGDHCSVLPIRTHLLGTLDDPAEVLRHYAGAVLQPGDVLTIGETPLAVMQGRYHHPAMVEPSPLARLLCRVFHPTSSLATACGMQTLIDDVGPAVRNLDRLMELPFSALKLDKGVVRLLGSAHPAAAFAPSSISLRQ